jgi:hypothetical protein
LALAIEPHGHAAGIDEEVNIAATEEACKVEPLYACSDASGVDGAGGQAVGREGETPATGATQGLRHVPGGSIEGGEIGLENELELDDGGGGV